MQSHDWQLTPTCAWVRWLCGRGLDSLPPSTDYDCTDSGTIWRHQQHKMAVLCLDYLSEFLCVGGEVETCHPSLLQLLVAPVCSDCKGPRLILSPWTDKKASLCILLTVWMYKPDTHCTSRGPSWWLNSALLFQHEKETGGGVVCVYVCEFPYLHVFNCV